jgi:CSLREA domain-containing protein
MKLYTALISGALLALHNTAFALVTLPVNTVNDEFGENLANCSLREAIQSINTRSAFGGCIAGQRSGTNVIKLEAKEYLLTRGELLIQEPITITGVGSDPELIDSIQERKPKRHAPTTVINAQNKSRLFNSAVSKPSLSLNNIKLINGYAEDIGGAILSGGTTSTFNVIFENNLAKNAGGALYLLGKNSALVATDSLWRNNQVTSGAGAAVSMSCQDDLKLTTRTVDMTNSSFIANGNNNASSVFEGCGILTLNLKTSTIGENTAANTGAIINLSTEIASTSSLVIEHSTLVQNKVAPVIRYNQMAVINIKNSVLAFNEAQGCINNNNNDTKYVGDFNLFENCAALNIVSTSTNSHDEDVHLPLPNLVQFSNIFNNLGNYGGYTPTYLPKITPDSKIYILDKVTSGNCHEHIDQRGSATHTVSNVEGCDLGAVERRVPIAVVDLTNVFSNKDKTDRLAEINVLDNDIAGETDFTDDTPDARGKIAQDADGKYLIEITDNHNGACSIIHRTEKNLLPLLRFDSGGQLLTDTQKASCKYTFTDSNGNKAIVGELLFKIENKLPKANADSFFLASGSSSVAMNVAANDNDEDDGKYGGLCTENTVKCNGGYYIRVVSSPSLGIIEGDSRECPDHSEANKYICYRGNLTYRPKNTLAPFNDSFTYVVYDTDLGVSAEATVTVINENAQIAEQNSSGSITWLSILTLAGMVIYRRRKSHIV